VLLKNQYSCSVMPYRLLATDVTEQRIASILMAMQTAGIVVTFQKILVFRRRCWKACGSDR